LCIILYCTFFAQCPWSCWRTNGRRRDIRDPEEDPQGVLDVVDVIVRIYCATMRSVPVLLLPSADMPADAYWLGLWVHRDDTKWDTRRRLRAGGERIRRYGRPVAGGSGAGIVWPANNTVPVGWKLDVWRPGRHCRQCNGPRGQCNAARRRLEHDGMSRYQVNDNNIWEKNCNIIGSSRWINNWSNI